MFWTVIDNIKLGADRYHRACYSAYIRTVKTKNGGYSTAFILRINLLSRF